MPIHHKLVFFAAEPRRLAEFWSAALGYAVEDHAELIGRLLSAGVANEDDVLRADGRLAWREAAAIRHPDDPVDPRTGIGLGRRILFELDPQPKAGENRLHLDLHVGQERLAEETRRLQDLGATLMYERNDPPRGVFNRLADPEGNEFCVQ